MNKLELFEIFTVQWIWGGGEHDEAFLLLVGDSILLFY